MGVAHLPHILAAILILALPPLGRWQFHRLRASLAQSPAVSRIRTYRRVLLQEWLLFLVAAPLWYRAWSEPALGGNGVSALRFVVGSLIVVGLVIFLALQNRQVHTDAELRAEFREKMSSLADLLPHRPPELRAFRALAISAGICEETIYRGFLVSYLDTWMGLPVAIVLAAIVFGLGHLYQGVSGILKTAAVGLGMSLLFLLTGSLLHAIILHAAIDWFQGEMAYRSVQPENGPQDQPA